MIKALSGPVLGHFQFPLLPRGDESRAGTLDTDKMGGVRVKVMLPDTLPVMHPKSGCLSAPNVVHGWLENSKVVTLIGAVAASRPSAAFFRGQKFSASTMVYSAPMAFVGPRPFDRKTDQIRFLCARINGLNEWAGEPFFTREPEIREEQIRRTNIAYEPPDDLFLGAFEGMGELRVSHGFELSNTETRGMEEAAMRAARELIFKSGRTVPAIDLPFALRVMRDFVGLGLGFSTRCTAVTVSASNSAGTANFEFYDSRLFAATHRKGSVFPLLFSLPGIKDDASGIVGRWVNLYGKHADALSHYFHNMGRDVMDWDARFLAAAQSIENLRQPIFGGRAKKRGLDKHQLDLFFENFSEMTEIRPINREDIVARTLELRNKAAHTGMFNSADYPDMGCLSAFMSMLMRYALLHKIGVPREACRDYVKSIPFMTTMEQIGGICSPENKRKSCD